MTSPAFVGRVTADLPGLEGRIRTAPENFLVEEIPLYEPEGRGDHTAFVLEKRGISTFEALLWVSKAVQVSEHVIGYAGLKDALAVTRQWMSVPRVPPDRVLAIDHPRIRVLLAARHTAPIRIGHLKGNRFTIRISGARLERLGAAREGLARLAARGVPNAYGVQRFGVKEDGHLMGHALVRGDLTDFLSYLLGRPHPNEGDARVRAAREAYDRGDLDGALKRFPMKLRIQKRALATLIRTGSAEEAFLALGKRPRKIYVSAYQSWVFNRCLDARVSAGTYDRLLDGDLAWLHASGACYRVDDAAREAGRAARFEASPSGPLPGYDLRRPAGLPLEIEKAVFAVTGIEEEAFRAPLIRTRGSRRPYRVPLLDASLEPAGDSDVIARFTLPPGAFATVVLDELMKSGEAPPVAEEVPSEDVATEDAVGEAGGEGAPEDPPDVPEGA